MRTLYEIGDTIWTKVCNEVGSTVSKSVLKNPATNGLSLSFFYGPVRDLNNTYFNAVKTKAEELSSVNPQERRIELEKYIQQLNAEYDLCFKEIVAQVNERSADTPDTHTENIDVQLAIDRASRPTFSHNIAASVSPYGILKALGLAFGVGAIVTISGCTGHNVNGQGDNHTANDNNITSTPAIIPQETPVITPTETPAYAPSVTPTNPASSGILTIYGNNHIHKINYTDRAKINGLLSDAWGGVPQNFSKYSLQDLPVDIFLEPTQTITEVQRTSYGALYKIVPNTSGKSPAAAKANVSSSMHFSDALEAMYAQAVKDSASNVYIVKKIQGDYTPPTPALVLRNQGKVAVDHATSKGDNYIAVGINTAKGRLEDNSADNMLKIIGDAGLYTGSGSVGGGGSSSSGSSSGGGSPSSGGSDGGGISGGEEGGSGGG
ncbi:Uncharacterised protein [uncultured archaeon]|nr:Uncharacterised protein [uncultured archaeon]